MTRIRRLCLAALLGATTPLAAGAQPARHASASPASAPVPTADFISALRRQAAGATARRPTGTLNDPFGITVDSNGNLYVANLFGNVNVYNDKYKMTGAISTGLNMPAAVAVAFNGNIYVGNNGTGTVTIYTPKLALTGTITDSTLAGANSMFIDADDTLWVLDNASTLHAYLADGTFIAATKTGGTAVGPWGPFVTVWGIANASGGYDEGFGNRATGVRNGLFLNQYFPSGSPLAAAEAQDQYGQEYVSDVQNYLIQIWSRDANYQLGQIHTPAAPYGVAIDPIRNRVYVALTTLNEVEVYSTKPPYKLLHVIK